MKFKVTNTIRGNFTKSYDNIEDAEVRFEETVRYFMKERILLTKIDNGYECPEGKIIRSWSDKPIVQSEDHFKSGYQCELCGDAISESHGFCSKCKKSILK